jgi:MSHA biogenesis protein MshK
MNAVTAPRSRARGLTAGILLSLAYAASVSVSVSVSLPVAARQALPDPTRPPPEASMTPGGAMAMPSAGGPQLQSVLVSNKPGGRRIAVIDGQTVRLGGKFDGAVLVKVTDTEAVLRRGQALQVLTLFPKPESNTSVGAPVAAAGLAAAPAAATAAQQPPDNHHHSEQ